MVDSKKTRKEPVEEIQALWRAQEELRKGEELYRALFVTNPDGIIVCDMEGKLLDANKAFVDMLGYTIEELRGKTYKQITPRKWHKIEADIIKNQILAKGFSEAYEKEYIRKDGSIFPVAVRVNTTKDEQGKPLLAWCFMRDITERKKMEEELRQSEEKYRSLIANIPAVVWTSGQNGNTIFISSNVERVYGYSPEEIYKGGDRLWFGRIHPDDVDGVKESFRKVFEKATPLDIEYRIQRKEGEWIWIQDRSFEAYEEDGVRYADGVFFDITRRKRAEEKLRFSLHFLERANLQTTRVSLLQELVREIQEFTGCQAVAIRMLDESGNIPYEARVGFSKEFYELESPLSVHSDECMCINVIRGQTDAKLPFYTEGGSFYMNGTTRFLATVSQEDKGRSRNVCNEFGYESVALVPIRLKDSLIGLIHVADSRENMVPLELVETLEKITTQVGAAVQRVTAEEKLWEHAVELEARVEERTRNLVERVKELNCLYSISSLLQDPNLSLREVFQRTVDLIPPSWRYPEITCARLVLEDEEFRTENYGKTAWKQASNIVVRDVKMGLVEVCYLEEKPQRDEGPFLREERNLVDAIAEHLGCIVVYKRMEELERQHQVEELAHFARLSTIGEMSSALAHELNQPLCAIVTHTEGALRMMKSGDWDSNELLEAIQEAGTQAERAGKIIRRIANLVRKKESHRSSVNIWKIIGETINLIEYEARLKGITIQWVEPSENSPMLKVDRIQIQQVLVNLLHNSFEAMKNVDQSKRQISIEVSTDENDMVQVVVSDKGCGLSAESTDRIFESFFTTNSQGLGMGLSISRSIIEAHGGRIWAESNPTGGATFRFTLPM